VPLGAHLVGSVPLPNAEQVLRTVGRELGSRLRRIPDGETGPRADWIVWQYPVLSSRSQFEVAPPTPYAYRALPRLRLRPGERGDDIAFEQLGYAEAALSSFRTFSVVKRDGELPGGCRFQVSLPTPLAPISAFVSLGDQPVVERAYEAAIALEVERIVADVPHDQLAIQWDTNVEFGMLEGDVPAWFPDVEAGIVERLVRLGRLVPPDVELGFHFCLGHDETRPRHVPVDLGRMVEIANALATGMDRPLGWLHMPVPTQQHDDRPGDREETEVSEAVEEQTRPCKLCARPRWVNVAVAAASEQWRLRPANFFPGAWKWIARRHDANDDAPAAAVS